MSVECMWRDINTNNNNIVEILNSRVYLFQLIIYRGSISDLKVYEIKLNGHTRIVAEHSTKNLQFLGNGVR